MTFPILFQDVFYHFCFSVSFSKLLNKRFGADYQTAAYLHAPRGMASSVTPATFGLLCQMFRFGVQI